MAVNIPNYYENEVNVARDIKLDQILGHYERTGNIIHGCDKEMSYSTKP